LAGLRLRPRNRLEGVEQTVLAVDGDVRLLEDPHPGSWKSIDSLIVRLNSGCARLYCWMSRLYLLGDFRSSKCATLELLGFALPSYIGVQACGKLQKFVLKSRVGKMDCA